LGPVLAVYQNVEVKVMSLNKFIKSQKMIGKLRIPYKLQTDIFVRINTVGRMT